MSEVRTLVIDRSRWLATVAHRRVSATQSGVLYDSKTKRMCCLGFLARKCGMKVKDICDVPMPHDSYFIGEEWPVRADESWCEVAADVNDSGRPTHQKESFLKKHFAKIGIKLEFKGKLDQPKESK